MPKVPECVITAYPDGPLLVRGAHRVIDANGNEFEVTRPTVALCRCGRSGQKPWCDSTHKLTRFRDPVRPRRRDPEEKAGDAAQVPDEPQRRPSDTP